MQKVNIAGIGLILFFAGLYFFPAGMDFLYFVFMSIYGDFWRATVALYAMSILLMAVGIAIASHKLNLGPLNLIKSPVFMILVVVITLGTMFVMLPR